MFGYFILSLFFFVSSSSSIVNGITKSPFLHILISMMVFLDTICLLCCYFYSVMMLLSVSSITNVSVSESFWWQIRETFGFFSLCIFSLLLALSLSFSFGLTILTLMMTGTRLFESTIMEIKHDFSRVLLAAILESNLFGVYM